MFRNARAAGAAATASAGGGSTAVQPRFSGSTAPLPSSTGLNRVKPLCEVPDPNEHVGSNLRAEEDFSENVKSMNLDPRLTKLIHKYQEVFGALLPPLSCKKLVQMDLKLK